MKKTPKNNKLPDNNLSIAERHKLVEDNQNLVWHYVHKLCKNPQLFDDCFQEGCMGLMRAARLFDDSRESTFTMFAAFEIQCSIRDFLFFNRDIRLPDVQRAGITAYYKKINALNSEEVDLSPSLLYDTAKEFGLTDDVATRLVNPTISMQATINGCGDDALFLEDLIATNVNNVEDYCDSCGVQYLVRILEDISNSLAEDIIEEDAEFGIMIRDYFREFVNKALGKEDALSMIQLVKKRYPEFEVKVTDNDSQKADKLRMLDNKYCNLSGKWVKHRKMVANMLKEYMAITASI